MILSAETYGTPTILLHSGIGDAQTLSNLRIPIIHELPSVGKNLSEQPSGLLSWSVNTTDTTDTAARNSTLAAEQFAQWISSHSGPLADDSTKEIGFFRVNKTGTPIQNISDPAAGPNTANFELLTIVESYTYSHNHADS